MTTVEAAEKKKKTEAFLNRIYDNLKSTVDHDIWDAAVKEARAHAGGKTKAEKNKVESEDEMTASEQIDLEKLADQVTLIQVQRMKNLKAGEAPQEVKDASIMDAAALEAGQTPDLTDSWKDAKDAGNVNYRACENPDTSCGTCDFFRAGKCDLVAGEISTSDVCDEYSKANVKGSLFDFWDLFSEKSETDDGQKVEKHNLFFEISPKIFEDPTSPPDRIPYLPKPHVFDHPIYGQIDITRQRNMRFMSNFKNRVYMWPVPLDAEHETKLSGAVAWITDLEMNEDSSVDAKVMWTQRGKELMAGGGFRFISPEWYDEWSDPATDQAYKDVAIGGAITSRPFFKEPYLRALVASENGLRVIEPPRKKEASEQVPVPESKTVEEKKIGNLSLKAADSTGTSFTLDADQTEYLSDLIENLSSAADLLEDFADLIGLPDDDTEADDENETSNTASEKIKRFTQKMKARIKMTDQKPVSLAGISLKASESGEIVLSPESFQSLAAKFSDIETKLTATEGEKSELAQKYSETANQLKTLSETAEAQSKQLSEVTGTLRSMAEVTRTKKFTDEVLGKGEESGVRWVGDVEQHVTFMKTLDDLDIAKGEGSNMLQQYVEQQRAVAAQIKNSSASLFGEVGSSARAPQAFTSIEELDSRANAEAKKYMEQDSSLSLATARIKFWEANPALYQQYSDAVKTRRR